ncbi:MAG: DegV family protein [Bacillota bacterium]
MISLHISSRSSGTFNSACLAREKSFLGTVLAIKPIITRREGVVEIADKVRTYRRAVGRLAELAVAAAGNKRCRVVILHANCLDQAREFAEGLRQKINCTQLWIHEIGPGLAVHGGQGMLGVATLVEGGGLATSNM